jgi:hypothetical protein
MRNILYSNILWIFLISGNLDSNGCHGWSMRPSFQSTSRSYTKLSHGSIQNCKASSFSRLFCFSDSSSSSSSTTTIQPQIWSNGFSSRADLREAIQEATQQALEGLPPLPATTATTTTSLQKEKSNYIDFAFITISSQYDGQVGNPSSCVIPTILDAVANAMTATTHFVAIQSILGCTTSTVISSIANPSYGTDEKPACSGIDAEATPAVSILFAKLPDVQIQVRVKLC